MLTRLPSAAVQMSCHFTEWCSGQPVYLHSGETEGRQAVIIVVLHDFPKFFNVSAVTFSGSDEVSSF